jgi:chromosome segregation ATPase
MARMRVGGIPDGLKSGADFARAPLRDIAELIGTVTKELRSISKATAAMEKHTRDIPKLHERLEAIEERVTSMDSEVSKMRQGVDTLQLEVVELAEEIAPLGRLAGRLKRRDRRPAADGAKLDEAPETP